MNKWHTLIVLFLLHNTYQQVNSRISFARIKNSQLKE